MEIKRIITELNKAEIDPKANIKLVKITGDKEISVYAAEISPKTYLNPHYHNAGIEIYQIVEGEGEMRIGNVKNNMIKWEEIFKISGGDFFSIESKKVHQIVNTSDKPLIAIFTCSEKHLSTDRHFI